MKKNMGRGFTVSSVLDVVALTVDFLMMMMMMMMMILIVVVVIVIDRAFSVAASRARNRLPTELKLLRSTDSFRRNLKTFLFHSVYGHQDTD